MREGLWTQFWKIVSEGMIVCSGELETDLAEGIQMFGQFP